MAEDLRCAIGVNDAGPDSNYCLDEHSDNHDGRDFGDAGGLHFDSAHIVKISRIINTGNDRSNNTEAQDPPEPVFHVDDLKHDVGVVYRDECFPAWLASLFENSPASDDK